MMIIELNSKDAFRLGKKTLKCISTIWLGTVAIINYSYRKENKELRKEIDTINKKLKALEEK